MKNPVLILASQSPRRRELLGALNIEFVVHQPGDVEEIEDSDSGPEGVVLENARRKACDVAGRFPSSWVLGSETVVALGKTIYGKPRSMSEAESMLVALQGREHQVYTGMCLIHSGLNKGKRWCEETKVAFRPLDREQIKDYLSRIDPMDKAGSYAIQEEGERIVGRIEGSLSNVVGLPLESLERELEAFGIKKSGPS